MKEKQYEDSVNRLSKLHHDNEKAFEDRLKVLNKILLEIAEQLLELRREIEDGVTVVKP